jgi:DNA-binding MarR family transcriptional regulator
MSILEDATRLLLYMAEHLEEGDEESMRGHYKFDAKELADALSIAPPQLNDSVQVLEDNDYVNVQRYMGTAPFRFAYAAPTSRGRAEAERLRAEQNEAEAAEQAGQRGGLGVADPEGTTGPQISRSPLPVGSPYGFTTEDWERVALDRDDADRLIVVFGRQWESGFYDSDPIRENIGALFAAALETVPEEVRRGVALDYRPLEGGYGGHLFNEIARDIIAADVAVFETSDQNANVMIEMGVALTWGRRVLPIRRKDAPGPPSDISGQTWATYSENGTEWSDEKHLKKVAKMVELALQRKRIGTTEA